MAHNRVTTLEERITIDERAIAGDTDRTIAEALRRSRWTVRKWRRRAQHGGRTRLHSTYGRPATGPLGSFPDALRAHIRQLRLAHPGWGPATIHAELAHDPLWADQPLPSRARIGAFLKAQGLTRRYQRHTELPEPARQPAPQPHAVWELDAKGVTTLPGLGMVSIINIIDVGSRVKVESYPAAAWAPSFHDYQLALRRAFLVHGLPGCISFDRGTVFFDNTCPSPFPTRLHLWLIALGVEVQFIRPRRPTDHGMVERMHQTIDQQAIRGQQWRDFQALWGGLDARRVALNTILPCRPLNGYAPLVVRSSAAHSQRPYRPEWEAEMLDLHRIGAYLATARWFRQITAHGQLNLGAYKYCLGSTLAGQMVEVTFDPEAWVFVVQSAKQDAVLQVKPMGLTKEAFIGDAARQALLPAYQISLPFTREAWRTSEYVQMLRQQSMTVYD